MAEAAQALAHLISEFWRWRTSTQPDSFDDIPRVRRPNGWIADWSAESVADRRAQLTQFTARHQALNITDQPIEVQVDARLFGVGLARVRWELDLLRSWQRNPCFYIDQSLVPIYIELLAPPPFDDERAAAIVRHLERVPIILDQARQNLTGHAAAPFAMYAQRLLADGPENLQRAMTALGPLLPAQFASRLPELSRAAAGHVADYRDWLSEQTFSGQSAVGKDVLTFFLHQVALLPYTVDEMLDHARREYQRAAAAEAVWETRASRSSTGDPSPSYIVQQHVQEEQLRRFYADAGLLDLPETVRHYRFALMPPYLDPLTWLGVPHYISSLQYPDEEAVRYVRALGPDLPYFEQSKALDPRTGIVHEGVHAHQLALSWMHTNPARRHFYDSLPNEGIAFYNEELMLMSGLFDTTPASGAFLANGMRLRALRVRTDLGLATGDLSIDQAADLLAETVPLDRTTAWQEAAFFASNPGQGLSYQIGKMQILDLLATASAKQDDFDLRSFHSRLWREGNVPLVLQRWELLGLRDQLDTADRLAQPTSS
ncbi:DUF885 family protein [Kribbella sp. NPDC006257]|uniref:DUF885 family protein n=1 Tax=Kribbella sp. NPDC006257 TaxID=3156738 RepID=UPI0033A14160